MPLEELAAMEGMTDELGLFLASQKAVDLSVLRAKATKEFSVFQAMQRKSGSINWHDIRSIIVEIHRRMGVGGNGFRTNAVQLAPNADDVVTVFPDWRECDRLIYALAQFIDCHVYRYPTVAAMVSYAGVVHAHPFSDGNGRTARVLYNLVLNAGGNSHFIPINIISALTSGVFILKLRRAYFGGDWIGLQDFLHSAHIISNSLQSM